MRRSKLLAKPTDAGNPSRVSTTKCVWETYAWPGIEPGYGDNVENWAISRIMSKSAMLGYDRFSENGCWVVYNEGLSNLSRLKVRSGFTGNFEDSPGWSRV